MMHGVRGNGSSSRRDRPDQIAGKADERVQPLAHGGEEATHACISRAASMETLGTRAFTRHGEHDGEYEYREQEGCVSHETYHAAEYSSRCAM